MSELDTVAPAFVSMAHRIVWCSAATVGLDGRPRSRVLHPIWEWDGDALKGWIATSPQSPKATELQTVPALSLNYWAPNHDTCTADCAAEFESDPAAVAAGWRRFAEGPAPVGYDPAIIPGWEDPESPGFGVLRLAPHRLRVMPGTVITEGHGELLTWSDRPSSPGAG
ncbi:pyridoxamine 5'-phosphate oxidase family protein [soil metagenome]